MACIWVTAHQQMERFFPWPQDQASVSLTPLWDESYQRKVCACVWRSVEGGCSPISVKGFIFLSRLPRAFKVLLVPNKPAPFCINVCFSHESLWILCWHNWLNFVLCVNNVCFCIICLCMCACVPVQYRFDDHRCMTTWMCAYRSACVTMLIYAWLTSNLLIQLLVKSCPVWHVCECVWHVCAWHWGKIIRKMEFSKCNAVSIALIPELTPLTHI